MNVATLRMALHSEERSWWQSYKWLLLRRTSQLSILGLFLLGPWFDLWLVKGNLSSSLILDVLPLTDPYLFLQVLVAGHLPLTAAMIGVAIVTGFYLLVGGRIYCSWVCPVNMITDAAHWLRERLSIRSSSLFTRKTRYWLLPASLILAMLTGTLAWELVNPVSLAHRGLFYGMGLGWAVMAAIFLLDFLVSRRAWCGHLCPMGAFYSLLSWKSVVRIRASQRSACNDCLDCYAVCPEPQVIKPVLKGAGKGVSPVITAVNCTNCGRCIDVCGKQVFEFGTRFNHSEIGAATASTPYRREE